MTGGNQLGKRQYHPSVASLAVGRELVVALIQSGKATEINHGATLSGIWAHGVSLRLCIR